VLAILRPGNVAFACLRNSRKAVAARSSLRTIPVALRAVLRSAANRSREPPFSYSASNTRFCLGLLCGDRPHGALADGLDALHAEASNVTGLT
jgi:hypothetical protein